jgi:hypothetical protein
MKGLPGREKTSARECDGLRSRDLRGEWGLAVHRLLHHQIKRHGYGTLDLSLPHLLDPEGWPGVANCDTAFQQKRPDRAPVYESIAVTLPPKSFRFQQEQPASASLGELGWLA